MRVLQLSSDQPDVVIGKQRVRGRKKEQEQFAADCRPVDSETLLVLAVAVPRCRRKPEKPS